MRTSSLFVLRRETRVATKHEQDLQLHMQFPPVQFLLWDEADRLVRACSPKYEALLWFTLTRVYRDFRHAETLMAEAAALGTTRVSDFDSSKGLLDGDLDQMIRCRFVTQNDMKPEDVRFPIVVFSVVEEREPLDRRRMIGWTVSTNSCERARYEATLGTAAIPFASAASSRTAARFSYAAHADFKKFFQQFELLAPQAFCFVYKGKVYQLASVPTGAVGPPIFAEILTRAITAFAIRYECAGNVVMVDTMIDNVRFYSDCFDTLQRVWKRFVDCCAALHITIGECMPPSKLAPYKFMGIGFDHVAHDVSLSEKTKQKLHDAHRFLEICRQEPAAIADIASAFGITFTAAQTLGEPMHRHYFVFKFMKRIAHFGAVAGTYSATHLVWSSVITPWQNWIVSMLSCPKTTVTVPGADLCIVYSDASDKGWGIVIFWPDGTVTSHGEKWTGAHRDLHINQKELKAALFAILRVSREAVRRDIPALKVALNIDNTTTIGWLRRQRADHLDTNTTIGKALTAPRVIVESITYCRSEHNLADAPSRAP